MAGVVCKLLEILATIERQLLDRQQKLQLLRVVLCSFHLDAPLAHQLNEIQNCILTLPLPHGKW